MHLASVTAAGSAASDRLLGDVVARLRAEGARVLGALRPVRPDGDPGFCESDLWLLPDGPTVRITQDLGPGSSACRMDAAALEDAVGRVMARFTADGADLIVLNKFGLSEAEGRGFRALIAEALARGIPVLTGLSETHRAAFEHFAEGLGVALPPEEKTVLAWCRSALGRPMAGLPAEEEARA